MYALMGATILGIVVYAIVDKCSGKTILERDYRTVPFGNYEESITKGNLMDDSSAKMM